MRLARTARWRCRARSAVPTLGGMVHGHVTRREGRSAGGLAALFVSIAARRVRVEDHGVDTVDTVDDATAHNGVVGDTTEDDDPGGSSKIGLRPPWERCQEGSEERQKASLSIRRVSASFPQDGNSTSLRWPGPLGSG